MPCCSLPTSTPLSALLKNKRSPSRRTKSRWEPLPEEKPIDKLASSTNEIVKFSGWIHANEKDRKVSLDSPLIFWCGVWTSYDNSVRTPLLLFSAKKEKKKRGCQYHLCTCIYLCLTLICFILIEFTAAYKRQREQGG